LNAAGEASPVTGEGPRGQFRHPLFVLTQPKKLNHFHNTFIWNKCLAFSSNHHLSWLVKLTPGGGGDLSSS
jgi:hypothetical protein